MRLAETRSFRFACGAVLVGWALAPPASAALQPPVAVSPGTIEGGPTRTHPCPTFTWSGGVPGAEVELALWHGGLPETSPGAAVSESEPPLWSIRLPAGTTAWSAAGALCLAEDGAYRWRVRAAFGAQRSRWSPALALEAAAAPGAAEVARLLDLLERWARESGRVDESAHASAADTRRGARPAAARRLAGTTSDGLAAGGNPPSGLAPPLGAPAVDAELPDTGVETYGVLGTTHSTFGDSAGVFGYAAAITGPAAGVYGRTESTTGIGVFGSGPLGVGGSSETLNGSGVIGESTGDGFTFGTFGLASSADGAGAGGENTASSGAAVGVLGTSASTTGRGVLGEADSLTGATHGVHGYVASSSGTGVYGFADAGSGFTAGVFGSSLSVSGTGVYGAADALTGSPYGVIGYAGAPTGIGASGWGAAATGANLGVYGVSDSTAGTGVLGYVSKTTGSTVGVEGRSQSQTGKGVLARASSVTGINYGLYADTASPSGYAGYFLDRVYIGGNLEVTGTVSKGGGSFKIDHPLDPENRYLLHSFVESPDMMNLYNGVATIDEDGFAWIELPAWFEALNRDFRYHLTPLGRFAPLYVAEEIQGGRFRIGGGIAGQRVSWLVTGVRQDAFANRYRIPVEEPKAPEDRGYFLHPEAFGLGPESGLRSAAPDLDEREPPAVPPRP